MAAQLAQLRQRLGLDKSPPAMQLPPDLVINGNVDATLQRFLKARDGNVDKAHAMLLKCIAWRAENDITNIFEHPLAEDKFRSLARYFPHAHHGFDKQGQPIYIDCTGKLDVESVLEHVTKEEVLHSHIIMMEYQNRVLMTEGSRRVGRTVHRMCNIVDMTGASTRLASRKAVEIFKLIAAVDQDNYPETMGATYVVNAPWVFTAVWRVIRVFLDDGVTAKVHILAEGAPTRDALLAAVDADTLPAFLGGTCRCPGGCVSGAACTAPGGLVPSQRKIVAFCEEFIRARAAGAPMPDSLLPAIARAAAPAPAGPQAAQLPALAAVRKGGGGGGGGSSSSSRRLQRVNAFRKPADEPPVPEPPRAPEEEDEGEEPPSPQPRQHEPATSSTPRSDCSADDAAAAAAAAEAAHAAALAAEAAAEAAAARQAALEAQADLEAAVADSHAAEHEARAAAKMAHYAAEEARAAARMAASAASALAHKVSATTHAAAAAVARRASQLSPAVMLRRGSREAARKPDTSAYADEDDDDAVFSDCADSLPSDDEEGS